MSTLTDQREGLDFIFIARLVSPSLPPPLSGIIHVSCLEVWLELLGKLPVKDMILDFLQNIVFF